MFFFNLTRLIFSVRNHDRGPPPSTDELEANFTLYFFTRSALIEEQVENLVYDVALLPAATLVCCWDFLVCQSSLQCSTGSESYFRSGWFWFT